LRTGVAHGAETTHRIVVTLDRATAERELPEHDGRRAVSGRLYVFLSQREVGEPMRGPNWFQPEPFFGVDVQDVTPGAAIVVDDTADGFPAPLSQLPAGKYRVQAILDHDFYCQNHARGVGNFHSDAHEFVIDPAMPAEMPLVLDKVVAEDPFPATDWCQEIVLRSQQLSQFFGRDVSERAAIVLPAGYDEHPDRRYPVIYEVPGFSGTHRPPARFLKAPPQPGAEQIDFIRVYLSGNCKWGHHVYADSATNGPRGAALVRDMIPHIDAHYRTVPHEGARFVTGHSSGGWSSLWLQVNYPDVFGGVWSTAPDPVDFRDFQQVDLYADPPLSLYTDPQGNPRPIARRGTEPFLWFANFGRMDDVLARGGQLRSFEAVFSPLDATGQPQRLWDRTTGQIHRAVAKAWEKYDIRLLLERHWPTLAPQLAGKLHIVMGELDTFYLDGATRKLGETLKALGSDATVEIVPDKGHGNLRTDELVQRFQREMTQIYRQHHPDG